VQQPVAIGGTEAMMKRFGLVAAMVAMLGAGAAFAQTTDLGSVTTPRRAMADGKPLPAGTYQLRLTTEEGTPVAAGQAPEQWVEFVRRGQVVGRELATIIPADQIAAIAESARPASGQSSVVILKGNEFMRVWVNHGGTNYLIHLALPAM
jgi:hypothetical protein